MTDPQIYACVLGFGFAVVALLVWMVIALDRVADRDVEERRKKKERKLP